METFTKSRPTWAVASGYAGGLLLAAVPALVELAMGEFILLLPIAIGLAVTALWPLRGSTSHAVFVLSLALALVTEVVEQIVFPDQVPTWADVAPPVLFTVAGIALIRTAHGASRRG